MSDDVDECDAPLQEMIVKSAAPERVFCTRPLGHRGPHRNGSTEWREVQPSTVVQVDTSDPATIERAAAALRAAFHDEPTPGHSTDAYSCWQCDTARAAVLAAVARPTGQEPTQ